MKEIKIALTALIAVSLTAQASLENHTSEVTIGVGAQYAPEYAGSNKYDLNAVPFFEWKNDSLFLNTEKGLGYIYEYDNGAYIGQSLGYSAGRTDGSGSWLQEGSKKLKGMGKINAAMTTTTTLGWWVLPWIGYEGNIIAPLTDSQGMQYTAKVNLVVFNDDSDTVTLSTEGKYGDSRFNNTWYGVSDRQSAQSGYHKYKIGSGLTSINYGINWQHSFNENWSGYSDINYTSLENKVGESPFISKSDYVTFTVGVFYTF